MSKLQEVVKDREAWHAAIHVVAKRHNLLTEYKHTHTHTHPKTHFRSRDTYRLEKTVSSISGAGKTGQLCVKERN